MKVVHKRLVESTDLRNARGGESREEVAKAIAFYEKQVKQNPLNEEAYRRMMIIYRRQKNYRKELGVIRAGIKAFENLYKPSVSVLKNKKVAALSKALLRSTGLADKKGNPLYQKEPIGSWTRRKLVVEKKLRSTG